MKKLITLALLLCFAGMSFSQGWRKGEMEIQIRLENESQASLLHAFHFNGEIAPDGTGYLYLVPKELLMLQQTGIPYEILKDDLNIYFADFWNTDDAYHSYQEIIDLMDSLDNAFPAICHKYVLGTSAGGHQLASLKISDNVLTNEAEAAIIFEGGIHGDEIGGPENCIRFARALCLGYGNISTITDLVDNREIWITCMINPDGRVAMSRYNDNGVDCNRDCGYMWNGEGNSPSGYSQPETRVLRDHFLAQSPVAYISFHSGTEFISFPWSYRPDPSADNIHQDQLASIYASTSGYSNIPYQQGYSGMYPINGSTKDAGYGTMGNISWSMEISMQKQPPASQIQYYYNLNEPAMLAMIEKAGWGMQGVVTDSLSGTPLKALVKIGTTYPIYTDSANGDYHKYLVAGSYNITVSANGYQSKTLTGVMVPPTGAVTANVQLVPLPGHYGFRVPSCEIPGNNFDDEGNTPASLGAPDNVNYSLGKGGFIVLDMQSPILNGPGDDLKIYEGDASPEGYAVHAGNTPDGPWMALGSGMGTQSFDLGTGSVIQARYLKIIDDNNGSASGNNAGFDLDAAEALPHPASVYLLMANYLFSDTSGNNNGIINPGETIYVKADILNNGVLVASNTGGTLSSGSPFISLPAPLLSLGNLGFSQHSLQVFPVSVGPAAMNGDVFSITLDLSANSGTYATTVTLYFVVGSVVEDFESGNLNTYGWITGGGAPWIVTSSNPYEGTYCARSGAIGNSQTSDLYNTFTVLADDSISFYRRVSSEAGYDFLRFFIDGTQQGQWSGNVGWGRVAYPVTAGVHTFKWQYIKDQGATGGSDAAWIDYVDLPPVLVGNMPLSATATANPSTICEGSSSQLQAVPLGGTGTYTYAWSPATGLSSVTAANPMASPLTTTAYTVTVTSGGNTATANVTVNVNPVPQVSFSLPVTAVCVNAAPFTLTGGLPAGGVYGGPGVTGGTFNPGVAGTGTQVLTYTVTQGICSNTSSQSIYVDPCTGIDKPSESQAYSIYPNPAGESLHVLIPGGLAEKLSVKILDPRGRILLETITGPGTAIVDLDIRGLAKGIYICHMQGQTTSWHRAFIKE